MQRNDDGGAACETGDVRKKGTESPIRRLSLSGACVFTPPPASAKAAKREYDISIAAPIGTARSCFPCDDYANDRQGSTSLWIRISLLSAKSVESDVFVPSRTIRRGFITLQIFRACENCCIILFLTISRYTYNLVSFYIAIIFYNLLSRSTSCYSFYVHKAVS